MKRSLILVSIGYWGVYLIVSPLTLFSWSGFVVQLIAYGILLGVLWLLERFIK